MQELLLQRFCGLLLNVGMRARIHPAAAGRSPSTTLSCLSASTRCVADTLTPGWTVARTPTQAFTAQQPWPMSVGLQAEAPRARGAYTTLTHRPVSATAATDAVGAFAVALNACRCVACRSVGGGCGFIAVKTMGTCHTCVMEREPCSCSCIEVGGCLVAGSRGPELQLCWPATVAALPASRNGHSRGGHCRSSCAAAQLQPQVQLLLSM